MSNNFWRSREIDDFDVGTYSKHNCAITLRCSFFRSFVIPLELIIFPCFPAIPLNSTSFPSEENFMKNSWKLKVLYPRIAAIGLLVQHQHNPFEWKALGYSIHILPWIAWYYGTFQRNLLLLHLQPSLDILVLGIRNNSITWLSYNE